MNAHDLKKALRVRYAPPEWVLLDEVRSHTGHKDKPTYADAFAMSTYPSRGLQTIGFEIKVSRADWLQELKNPDKADTIGKYCDLWYLVTNKADIFKSDEIPPNWGVLVYGSDRFRVHKEAVRNEATPLSREFVAALLRKATSKDEDYVHVHDVDERVRQQVEAELDGRVRKATAELQVYTWIKQAEEDLRNLLGLSSADIVRIARDRPWMRDILTVANTDQQRKYIARRLQREHETLLEAANSLGAAVRAVSEDTTP